jgi:hypothetical protein
VSREVIRILMNELSARYLTARRRRPSADENEIATMMLADLPREHVVTLATEWLGMAGRVSRSEQPETDRLAHAYVRNFVLHMDEQDDC